MTAIWQRLPFLFIKEQLYLIIANVSIYGQFCIAKLLRSMFWEVRKNCRIQRKHMQTWGEHVELHTDSILSHDVIILILINDIHYNSMILNVILFLYNSYINKTWLLNNWHFRQNMGKYFIYFYSVNEHSSQRSHWIDHVLRCNSQPDRHPMESIVMV